MKTKLIIIFISFCGNIATAQSIEKFSIDSGGASTTVDGISILYTIGEVHVQELSAGNISISEGFINSSNQETLGAIEVETPENDLRVFPNPTSHYIHIQANTSLEKIELYNLLGKRVLQLNTHKIDIRGLHSGIYILKIYTNNKIFNRRIIIN